MQFVKVATVGDLESGKGMVVVVRGTRVAIFNCGGTYYAIKGTCPHMGGELGEGLLSGEIVTCPWHGWRFNVKTGKNPESDVVGVRTFEVKVEGEDILLGV
ncbi:MAG: Rieske 2Fe-2S domain-containing protein [Candidatus Eisenbacteria bacterium]|uniref:Rieske 2Fe-2S domain-containing protein n=1 Tax=Eiseniibacteriota bacterium TaxID=2212470 RepID=A0A538T1X1_UNCEI|nr:MAG: Rieske 2Fe-2S domain-containing protein [Candidatus Eisenbacteria bacterium]